MMKGKGFPRTAVLAAVFILVCLLPLWGIAALDLIWPEATGAQMKYDDQLTVDYSNAANGYVMVRGPVTDRRLKLRIAYGETIYDYDLNGNGEYEVFPLQSGSGSYQCMLYQNASGSKYASAGKVSLNVTLNDENAAFLCPSQYVNYTADSPVVALSQEVCAGLDDPQAIFDAVSEYIDRNFVYDYIRAFTVNNQKGTLPDIQNCYDTKMGICQDLAAVAACMLRVQGIPTKLVVGYADGGYHAWNKVILNGEEILYDPTASLLGMGDSVEYVEERFY